MVGEDVMMVVELKSVLETVTIRLKRDEKTENEEVRRLKVRVGELEKEMGVFTEKMKVKVESLEGEVRELKEVGESYTINPTVTDVLLMRYAMAFHPPFARFLTEQLNTTAVEAFEKWKKQTCEKTLWQLTTEYLARARQLSMKVPMGNGSEVAIYAPGNPTSTTIPYQKGMYCHGCWQISPISQDSITKHMRVSGPYTFTYRFSNRVDGGSCSDASIIVWFQVTTLTPLTSAEKLLHNLS